MTRRSERRTEPVETARSRPAGAAMGFARPVGRAVVGSGRRPWLLLGACLHGPPWGASSAQAQTVLRLDCDIRVEDQPSLVQTF